MKVGIIGGGHIAGIHGPLILKQPNVKIVGIADTDITQAQTLATELEVEHCYQDAKTMIEEQRPDIVHVLVPPQYHASLSIMAMRKGCHVFVEKPIALTLSEAKKMLEVAKDNNVYICVNHNFIFDTVVQRALVLTAAGTIGDVISVEAVYSYNPDRNPALVAKGGEHCHWSYRLNGGPLQDLIPHPASLLMEFIPKINEVQWIGLSRGTLPSDWQDEIRVSVKSDRVIGYISISLNEKPDTLLLTIKGTQGIIQANLYNNILTIQRASMLPRAAARGLSGIQLSFQNLQGSLMNIFDVATRRIDKSGGIEPLITRLYGAIRDGGKVPIAPDKILRVADLIERIWSTPTKTSINELSTSVVTSRKKGKTPTALVTGGTGFIGCQLVKKLLSEKIDVRVLVRPNSHRAGRLHEFDVDIAEGDLADPNALYEAVKGIKTIYHAGATLSNNWDEHYKTNIKGTEHLIKASLTHQVERLVHISTLAVYELADLNEKNPKITEVSPIEKYPKRMGPYAYSKIEAENLLLEAHEKEGLPVTIVRPGIVIGPRGRVFFPHLGYHYRDKLFLLIGKGDTVLPLTYVENTVDGIYRASVKDIAIGQIYNLIDDGQVTVRDYLEQFIKVTGIEARIISLPYIIPYMATTAYETASALNLIKKGITSRRQLRWKHKSVHFDNTKAKQELGWQQNVGLQIGIEKTFDWYSRNN